MPPRHSRQEPALDFLEPAGVAWVDRPRTTWVVPTTVERRRATSVATRGVLVDGAAPLRTGGTHKVQPRDGAFADLPDELLVVVLRNQMGPRTLGRLARTCWRLHRVASNGALWSELFQRRFPRAYRSRMASTCTPGQIERMPWKQNYCEQVYEQWARRRHTQEQQRAREVERHKAEARQWCKVGGRGTQRLYNTLYPDASGSPSSVGRPDSSALRRPSLSSASLGSPVLERSLGTTGSSFFMEQMAANTRQFLKPSNKKRFLKAKAGEGRSEESRGRSLGRGYGLRAGTAAGAGRVHGMDPRRHEAFAQGGRRQQLRRPVSAAAPLRGRPKGPSLVPPSTA